MLSIITILIQSSSLGHKTKCVYPKCNFFIVNMNRFLHLFIILDPDKILMLDSQSEIYSKSMIMNTNKAGLLKATSLMSTFTSFNDQPLDPSKLFMI